jgi:hypothetical protein
MVRVACAKQSERAAALASVILLHVLALMILLYHRWPVQPQMEQQGTLKIIALSAPPAAPATPPRPLVPSEIQEIIEAQVEPQVSAEASAVVGTPGAACTPLELVRNAILTDQAALTSVLNAPPETRSIAEAVVLWNAGWSESASVQASPLSATRAAVERGLTQLDEACLDEPVAGPRLIPIPAASGTMFVVFGSGTWTWRQVTQHQPLDIMFPGQTGTSGVQPPPAATSESQLLKPEFRVKG